MRARRRSSLRANSGASLGVEADVDGEDDEGVEDEDEDDASEET